MSGPSALPGLRAPTTASCCARCQVSSTHFRGGTNISPVWQTKLLEGSTPPPTKDGVFSYTVYEPLGVVGSILPWNRSASTHDIQGRAGTCRWMHTGGETR